MIKVALKGLAGRKLRASLSAFAIILGVAMVSGTFVLTDTMNGAFNSIITQSYKNADVVVSGKTAFNTDSNGNTVQPPSFPESVLGRSRTSMRPPARSRTTRRSSSAVTAKSSQPVARRTSRSASIPAATSGSTHSRSPPGPGPKGRTRSRSTRARRARSTTRSATPSASRAAGPCSSSRWRES